MGKGASTSKTNVTKKLPDYSSDKPSQGSGGTGTGAGGGGSPESDTANVCLITFREKLSFVDDVADLIKVGFQFTLVPNEQEVLEIVSSGRVVGQYAGSKLALLKRCISSGYIYRGNIKAIDQNGADCEITGFGVGNGTASTM
jgi:hypothetical protein